MADIRQVQNVPVADAFLSQRSKDEETRLLYLRMEAAWRTLANEQEKLDKKGLKKHLN